MLYDTSTALQQADLDNADSSHPALQKLAATLNFYDGHAHHEDVHIFSLLEPHARHFVAEMEAEHVIDHALGDNLRALIAAFDTAATKEAKQEIGAEVCRAFNEFTVFNLTHMQKEETAVNELLWKHYSDIDIIQANRRLVASLRPEEAKESAYWLMRSASDNELARLLTGMKHGAPAEVFDEMYSIAREVLPPHRFEALQARVSEDR